MSPKLLLIVLDGVRPDAIHQANTPHIDHLWRTGAYTWTATSVVPSVTLPAHLSMFRGVPPQKHGVLDNYFHPAAAFPSFIDVAHHLGLHTAAFYSWEELRDLSSPGSLDFSLCRAPRAGEDTDHIVAQAAADYLVAEQPDLIVLHIDKVDVVGHAAGWMSPPYLRQLELADQAVGLLLTALTDSGLRDQYTILLLADHGGHDYGHGSADPQDLHIPWILNGPRVRQNHPIRSPIIIYDTAATIAHLLNLPLPDVWDGQPITDPLL